MDWPSREEVVLRQMRVNELTAEQEEEAMAIEELLLAKARITSRYCSKTNAPHWQSFWSRDRKPTKLTA